LASPLIQTASTWMKAPCSAIGLQNPGCQMTDCRETQRPHSTFPKSVRPELPKQGAPLILRSFSTASARSMTFVVGAEEALDDSSSAIRDAAYKASLLEFQTGIASFLALSARLAEIPEPGKTMRPIGIASSI
jgi:hypothetical protein